MAAATHRVSTASTVDGTSYVSGAFTPAASDLLIVVVAGGATVDTAATVVGSTGQTFTKLGMATRGSSGSSLYAFVANAAATAVSQTVTFDCTADAATGAIIFVTSFSSVTRIGASAIRQIKILSEIANGATPAPAFDMAVLTGNPVLGAVGCAVNPPALTPPTSFTERADVGYATPAAGAEYATVDSGFTGTTVTWGSAPSSASCSLILEVNTAAVDAVTDDFFRFF